MEESGNWNFAPALEGTGVVSLKDKTGLFINGEFVAPSKGGYFETINPASEEILGKVGLGTFDDVDLAVKSAREAFSSWSGLSGLERGKYLFRIARIIQEKSKEFAVLETLDGGKPIRESRDIDVPLAAAHFFYYAGWADKLKFVFPGKNPKPVGVVGQIIPWNFPLLMAAWKIAPALACGNTVVLKPAETTPLTAMLLAEVIAEAGLPKGVVNVVTGDGNTGAELVKHPDVNKIAFTGSTKVGKGILRAIAGADKTSTMELGGKAANIVFEDACIDQAVEGIINGIYFNQGHVCCAGSRLYVQESVKDELIGKVEFRMKSLNVGNPLDKNTDIGAINSRGQLETIQGYLENADNDGLEKFDVGSLPEKGFWCKPTLYKDVPQSARIMQEEIFGPVLAAQSFRTIEEVIGKANNTPYGLSAGVWTDKGSKAFNLAKQLNAGVIWANTYNKFDPTSPFGGYKQSGHGREGGWHGLFPYLKM